MLPSLEIFELLIISEQQTVATTVNAYHVKVEPPLDKSWLRACVTNTVNSIEVAIILLNLVNNIRSSINNMLASASTQLTGR